MPKEVQELRLNRPVGWSFDEPRFISSGYIWVRNLNYDLRARNEVILLARKDPANANALEKEITAKFFDLFNESRVPVEKANRALLKVA